MVSKFQIALDRLKAIKKDIDQLNDWICDDRDLLELNDIDVYRVETAIADLEQRIENEHKTT